MSKAGREAAEMVIAKALLDRLPDIVAPKNTANYILNQLMKAGFTNNKIQVHVDEVRDELAQAAFKCRTDETMGQGEALLVAGDSPEHRVLVKNLAQDAEDLANLIPEKIVLSPKDSLVFAAALEDSKNGNQRLRDLLAKKRPVVHYLSSLDGPLGKVACGDERAGEAISLIEEETTCPSCVKFLNTPTNPRSKG